MVSSYILLIKKEVLLIVISKVPTKILLFSGCYGVKEKYLTRNWILGAKDFTETIFMMPATYTGWRPHHLLKVPSSHPTHHIIVPTQFSLFFPFLAFFSPSIKVNAFDTN
jgi:hypothetical protein